MAIMKRKLTSLLFLLVATLLVASDSYADGNWWWGGSPYGFNNINRSDREIPFYAEHPPVYYSYIVPRTYGQSPYAYWPGPYTPTLTPEPIMVDNPYFDIVPEEIPAKPDDVKRKPTSSDKQVQAIHRGGPVVVLNPFVEQQPAVASSNK
jgi:hypothetical protein